MYNRENTKKIKSLMNSMEIQKNYNYFIFKKFICVYTFLTKLDHHLFMINN